MERGTWLYERARVKQISPNLKFFFILICRKFQFPFHVTFFTFSISFNGFYFSLVHIYLLAIHHICISTIIFSSHHPAVKDPLKQVQITQVNSFYCRSVMPCVHQPHCYYCTALLLNGQKYPSLDRHHLSHSSEGFTVLLQ